jgi:two-component system nitrogen regulation sensor histidine kinase GlnL
MSHFTSNPFDNVSEQILEQLTVAVLLINRQGEVYYCNQLAAMIFGQSKKKLQQQSIWDLLVYHTFPARFIDDLWQSGRSFSDSDVEMVFPDGRHIVTEVQADQAVMDEQLFCLLQIRQNDNLRKINQVNNQKHHISASRHLIRGLAHEIKNPLGGIRGAAQLLSRSLDSPELQEFTQLIMEQSDRLRDLVDRLLGPNTPPKRVATNIHVVLERVYNLVKLDKPEDIILERDYDPSLPDTVFDPNQIEQAVLNIVKNGIQALDSNRDSFDLEHRPKLLLKTRFAGSKVLHDTHYKQVLKIMIEDNGPGIDEELINTIFYPLVTTKSEGNGLGLSISQTLIEQHKGNIEIESWPGHTVFSIYLPVIQKTIGRDR